MDPITTVTLYALMVTLLALALASAAIWSRREFRWRMFITVIALLLASFAFYAFMRLPGKPDAMSIKEFRENYRCSTIVHAEIKERVGFLMLAKKKQERHSEYIFVSWEMRLASSLQRSQKIAKLNGKGTIVYGPASCRDKDEDGKGNGKKGNGKKGGPPLRLPGGSGQERVEGDGFTFYPEPVPPMPEKNYGPVYESPV